ncbi:MAG TPA: hypothetical protein VE913_14355 [Longimicrobium sp.]|nr:hypothetical protein [Longimicrobium sp.]
MSDVEEIEEGVEGLRFRDRPCEVVKMNILVDVMSRVRELAAAHDMSPEGPCKMYIGNGLRPDGPPPTQSFLATTADVLARHVASEEERTTILREIVSRTSEPVYVTGD